MRHDEMAAAPRRVNAVLDPERCVVAPAPELRERIVKEVQRQRGLKRALGPMSTTLRAPEPRSPGLNDGLIIPGTMFPLGTPLERVRSAALERAPLVGTVRVIIVLVEFTDQALSHTAQQFNDLFFSTGVIPTGSVREFYTEVSNGTIDIQGQVVGPYTLPLTMAQYANGGSGIGATAPNARTLARDAALAADPAVNFAPYDNDGNGFVDAFVVVHAGPGAEVTGNVNQIWSHKWVLAGGALTLDTTKIFAYLTVPEDARTGVCAHELGHLLFGWPDLYDTDGSSEGIGNWCLMAGGSWNGGGNTPAHPSAWCKVNQGWVSVVNPTTNGPAAISDVKDGHAVHRLWKDGSAGSEYFLVENRQRNRFDAQLPGDGLLIWHIDETTADNTDESHYRVALMQADGLRGLESSTNRGDGGDPWPGSTSNAAFNNSSTPNSKSYAGVDTCVSITGIPAAAAIMNVQIGVTCLKPKEIKERIKDFKEPKEWKERLKDFKDTKEGIKDFKDKEAKEGVKDFKDIPDKFRDKDEIEKRPDKPITDKRSGFDKPPLDEKPFDKPDDGKLVDGRPGGWERFGSQGPASGGGASDLEGRVAAIERALGLGAPFIGNELRPDLSRGALSAEEDQRPNQMSAGDVGAKRSYDTKPTE